MKKITLVTLIVVLTMIMAACAPAATAAPATSAPATQAAPAATTAPVATIAPAATVITIGYDSPELTGGQGAIMNGMVNGAKAQGWVVITSNANSDAATQANQIDSFISLGVKAIVAVPVDSKAICAEVAKAKDAGIPFFTIDRAPEGCAVDMTIQSDNYLAGKQAAETMITLLTKKNGSAKGTILEIQGDMGQNVAQLRGGGFEDVMKAYPDVKIIQKPANWDSSKSSAAVTDVASSTKLDGIYVHSDCTDVKDVMAALDQLGQLKKADDPAHIILAGVDGCHDTLQAIRDGYWDESSSQPLPDDGVVIAPYIAQILNGETIQPGTVTKDGALWSPATITMTDTGLLANLSTTAVTLANVDDKGLWGNQ